MRYELRPLGVGGVLDQSIALFKDRLGLFVAILLILRIPTTAVMQYALLSNMAQMSKPVLRPSLDSSFMMVLTCTVMVSREEGEILPV